jgi:hypothetical protein
VTEGLVVHVEAQLCQTQSVILVLPEPLFQISGKQRNTDRLSSVAAINAKVQIFSAERRDRSKRFGLVLPGGLTAGPDKKRGFRRAHQFTRFFVGCAGRDDRLPTRLC